MEAQEQVLRALAQFQGSWVSVEQVSGLTGLDRDTAFDIMADLDVNGLIDLGEKDGEFYANLSPDGAKRLGMVEVQTQVATVEEDLPQRKYLPPQNVRRAGPIQFLFEGTPPPGCLSCGGPLVGDNAFCIICEDRSVQIQQIPLIRPKGIKAAPTVFGPRKQRRAAKAARR